MTVTSELKAFHPRSASHREARDRLLQAALRPEPLPFGIAAEYPIVLSDVESELGFCFVESGAGASEAVVAHANLWPRNLALDLAGERVLRVGLVGNVATDERRRGQGIMRQVFAHLEQVAREQGLAALVLWSDLLEFYQKLGFRSCGRERRLLFTSRKLRGGGARGGKFCRVDGQSLGDSELARMLKARFPYETTLERSAQEFRAMLRIPLTVLFVGDDGDYLVMGKGADMAGVVHEWGARSPDELLSGLSDVVEATGLTQVMLLTPERFPEEWSKPLSALAHSVERHDMALAKPLVEGVHEALSRTFIWGLDSI